MVRNVEVSTVNEGEEAPVTTRMATAQQEATRSNSTAVAADNDNEPQLVQVMNSLREQLDRIETTYDSSRKQTTSSSRGGEEKTASTTPKPVESRSSLFGSTPSAAPIGGSSSSGVRGNGVSSPIRLDYDPLRSSSGPSRISSTPPRRTGNTFSSPVRFLESSVITEDALLQSDVLGKLPGTRTPPRPTSDIGPTQSSLSGSFTGERRTPVTRSLGATTTPGGTSDYFPLSGMGSRPRSTAAAPLTPSRSLHSPPPLAGVPTSTTTPFSSQKATNQSFVSYAEPEPVQTPSTTTQQLPPRGLSAAPELALLDSLLGTVEALKKRMDEQDVRLERVERDNDNLQEQVRFWRNQASRFERDWLRREEERFRREEDISELHRGEDRREWRRDDGRRDSWSASQNGREWRRSGSGLSDSPRRDWGRQNHTRPGLSRSDSRRSSEWDESPRRSVDRQDRYHPSPSFRSNDATPGSRFVAELSDKLPLNADQYQVLASLMNRYFVENENGRRER